jgi:2,3-bisphosphoglycerate-independent phosphoglycerate mutase
MGHQGSIKNKLEAIESLDEKVIKVVKEQMEQAGADYRLLIMPDHPTPIRLRTHTSNPVPYMLFDSSTPLNNNWNYNEAEAGKSGNIVKNGHEVINKLFER